MRVKPRHTWSLAAAATVAVAVTACSSNAATPSATGAASTTTNTTTNSGPASVPTTAKGLPKPAHVVVVMEENHSYADIIGNASQAPYINSLAAQGALMTSSFAVTHPSEPNYMALFGGSTSGLTADTCPFSAGSAPNLGSEVLASGKTFLGYSESLPATGSTVCTSPDGNYARKHSPWVNFSNVPASDSLPFTSFPTDFSTLPALSFVIPNLEDDMHNGTIAQGDTWLNKNLAAYATWAEANNSLLIVTWDEDDFTETNQIPTIIVGQPVKPGHYAEKINHYNVLATLEQIYGLSPVGNSVGATGISDIWS
jgi:phosphatidylinositol-3-phosphatase